AGGPASGNGAAAAAGSGHGSAGAPRPARGRPAGRRLIMLPAIGPVVGEAMRANAALRGYYGFMIFFLAFLLRTEHFGNLPDTVAVGAMIGAAAVGGFLGLAIGAALRSRAPQLIMFGMMMLVIIATAVCAVFFGLWAALAVALAAALGSTLAKLALDSIVQREIGEEVRSSTFAASETLRQLTPALVSTASGVYVVGDRAQHGGDLLPVPAVGMLAPAVGVGHAVKQFDQILDEYGHLLGVLAAGLGDRRRRLESSDLERLGTPAAFSHSELHALARPQHRSLRLQGLRVHEDLAAVVAGEKTEPFVGVIPLDLASRHEQDPLREEEHAVTALLRIKAIGPWPDLAAPDRVTSAADPGGRRPAHRCRRWCQPRR